METINSRNQREYRMHSFVRTVSHGGTIFYKVTPILHVNKIFTFLKCTLCKNLSRGLIKVLYTNISLKVKLGLLFITEKDMYGSGIQPFSGHRPV